MNYETLLERAKNDDHYIYWFQQKEAHEGEHEYAKKSVFSNSNNYLIEVVTQLIRRTKNNILMHLYITNRELIPSYFTSDKISEVLKSKTIKSNEAANKSHMFTQAMAILIQKCVINPEQFAENLSLFFESSEKQKNFNVEFFAVYTLPSFYGNMAIPDVLPSARRLAISLLSIDSESNLANYFCASFFLCSPKFIDFLWEDYIYYFITTTISYHQYKYFNIFLMSVEKASSFLTTHHIMIIDQLFHINPMKFAYVIIRLVLEPTLKARLQKDSTSHLYLPGNVICFEALTKIFDFIFKYPLNTSCAKALYRSMTRKTNTDRYSQNFGSFGFQYYPSIFSMKEFKILMNILSLSENTKDAHKTIDNIKPELQDSMINFVLPMYNILNESKTPFIENALLLPKPERIQVDSENRDHKFSFEKLKSNATQMGLNPIALLEPSFLDFSSPFQVIANKYHMSLEILQDEEFKLFSIKELINSYIQYYSSFETRLNMCFLIQQYKVALDSADKIFFLMIDEFLDDNSKLMRKRLSLVKSISETKVSDRYTKDCECFKYFTFGFDIAKYLPFKNEDYYVRKMQELMAMKGYTSKMEIKDLIVFFPLIFRFMRDFVSSQGLVEDTYEFKAHYFFLVVSMFSHQILNKLYNTFTYFFNFFMDNLRNFEDKENAKNGDFDGHVENTSRENNNSQSYYGVLRNHCLVEDENNKNFFNDAVMEEIIKEWRFFKFVFEENLILRDRKKQEDMR